MLAPSLSNPLFSSTAHIVSIFVQNWLNCSTIRRLHIAIVSAAYFLDGVTFSWMICPLVLGWHASVE